MHGVLETTLQKSNHWLEELTQDLHLRDHEEAYQALRATLHVLRDRLGSDQAAHLGAQLPMLIRGLYYEGWKPAATPVLIRNLPAFYDAVRATGGDVEVLRDTPRVVGGVLALLGRHVTPGELAKIAAVLPEELATLFQGAAPAGMGVQSGRN